MAGNAATEIPRRRAAINFISGTMLLGVGRDQAGTKANDERGCAKTARSVNVFHTKDYIS